MWTGPEVAGQTRLIANMQCRMGLGQLSEQLGNGVGRVVELAQIAHLPIPAELRHRDSVICPGRIDPDENLP